VAAGILSEKDQHAGLAAAAARHIVPFHHRVFAIKRYGMKIQIEGFSGQEVGTAFPPPSIRPLARVLQGIIRGRGD
jgi:hypothetical protein